jgi:hypothetical protein
MFLVGVKLALGLIAGLFLSFGMIALAFGGADLFSKSRRRRRQRLWEAKACASGRVAPQICDRFVLRFTFSADDWKKCTQARINPGISD